MIYHLNACTSIINYSTLRAIYYYQFSQRACAAIYMRPVKSYGNFPPDHPARGEWVQRSRSYDSTVFSFGKVSIVKETVSTAPSVKTTIPSDKKIIPTSPSDKKIIPTENGPIYTIANTLPIFTTPTYHAIVIVDCNSMKYFDYDMKRACSEIAMIHPNAIDNLYIVKFWINVLAGDSTVVITTPEHTITKSLGSTYEFSTVIKLLHNEIQKITLINSVKIVGCSHAINCSLLKIFSPNMYSGMINCSTVEQLINTCFDRYYTITEDTTNVPISVFEKLAKIVSENVDHYKHSYSPGMQTIVENEMGVHHITTLLRDRRFESIANLRFNPWLFTFSLREKAESLR